MELFALRYGSSAFPRACAFQGETGADTLPISWTLYLARHAGQVIVIDTGFTDAAVAACWGITFHQAPHQLLQGLGVTPDQVDDLIITHHHNDHIADLARYPRARVHITAAARAAYVSDSANGIISTVAAVLTDAQRTRVWNGSHELAQGGLLLEEIGGHSPGSAVVRLAGLDRRYLITGDECYLCANLLENRPIGIFCDHHKNLAFLARERAAQAIPLPFHDPLVFSAYQAVGSSPDVVRII